LVVGGLHNGTGPPLSGDVMGVDSVVVGGFLNSATGEGAALLGESGGNASGKYEAKL
jgi:hypothetical protein